VIVIVIARDTDTDPVTQTEHSFSRKHVTNFSRSVS